MSVTLKVGDRVRVKGRKKVEGYHPGDKGPVTAVPKGRRWYFLVEMDEDIPAAGGVIFMESEIEADV